MATISGLVVRGFPITAEYTRNRTDGSCELLQVYVGDNSGYNINRILDFPFKREIAYEIDKLTKDN